MNARGACGCDSSGEAKPADNLSERRNPGGGAFALACGPDETYRRQACPDATPCTVIKILGVESYDDLNDAFVHLVLALVNQGLGLPRIHRIET